MVINLQARCSKQYHFDVVSFFILAEKFLNHDIDHEQFKLESGNMSGNMYVEKLQKERGSLFFSIIFTDVSRLYEVVAQELAYLFLNRNIFPDYGEKYKEVVLEELPSHIDGIYKFKVKDSGTLISVCFNKYNIMISVGNYDRESRLIKKENLNNQSVSIDDEIIDNKQARLNDNENYLFRSETSFDSLSGGIVPIRILRNMILLNEESDLPGNKIAEELAFLVNDCYGDNINLNEKYDVLKYEDKDLKLFLAELFYGVDIDKIVNNLINTFDKEKALLIKNRADIISSVVYG